MGRLVSVTENSEGETCKKTFNVLMTYLLVTPSFKPPLATFDFEDSLVTSAAPHGNTGKAKKGKKPKKG